MPSFKYTGNGSCNELFDDLYRLFKTFCDNTEYKIPKICIDARSKCASLLIEPPYFDV